MAKTAGRYEHPRRTRFATVHVPKSQALYEVLQNTGQLTGPLGERTLNALAVKADPGDRSVPVVHLLATPTRPGPSDADAAAQALAILLAKARAEGHPAADHLAELAAQVDTQPAGG